MAVASVLCDRGRRVGLVPADPPQLGSLHARCLILIKHLDECFVKLAPSFFVDAASDDFAAIRWPETSAGPAALLTVWNVLIERHSLGHIAARLGLGSGRTHWGRRRPNT